MKQFLILFSLLLSTYCFAQQAKWVDYKNEECKIAIAFPDSVEEMVMDMEEGKNFNISASSANSTTYLLSTTIYYQPLEEQEDLAEVAVSAFAESLGGTVKEQKKYEYKKHSGIEATISLEQQHAELMYRVLLIDQIQYQMAVIYTQAEPANEKDIHHFFHSFKYLK